LEKKALLIVDVINPFDFENGEKLLKQTVPVAKNIAQLKKRAKQMNIPIIYVNDNFKNWQSDFPELISSCLKAESLGKQVVELLKPEKGDYHILKPSYSGFYSTPLHLLLEHLEVNSLIITGIAGNMCVQFTANDAFMLTYKLQIPADCIASQTDQANISALEQMHLILKANIQPSHYIKF
jgi:nicotinamidase-related amidase